MPWKDGRWVPEDASVATRLAGLTASDSPFLAQARVAAARTANRRGLLNSSLAAGAGEAAAINAALPIASQDAAQIAASNASDQQFRQSTDLAQQGYINESNLSDQSYRNSSNLSDQGYRQSGGLLTQQTQADFEKMRRDREAQAAAAQQSADLSLRAQTQSEGASRGNLVYSTEAQTEQQRIATLAQAALSKQEAGQQLTALEQQAINQSRLSEQESRQQSGIINQQADLSLRGQTQSEAAAAERDARAAAETRGNLEYSTAAERERLASSTAASERANTLTASLAANNQYLDAFTALANNPDVPADVRAQYQAVFESVRQKNMDLVSQIQNVALTW